jgi:transcriptional regulator with XRE-family HTH domain
MAVEAERIGARMRERRLELGLKQREVADRIPGSTEGKDVSRWENGKHRPQGDTLEALAQALETDVEDLYAGPMSGRKPTGETPDPFGDRDGGLQLDRLERIEAMLTLLLERVSPAGEDVAELDAAIDRAREERAERLDRQLAAAESEEELPEPETSLRTPSEDRTERGVG